MGPRENGIQVSECACAYSQESSADDPFHSVMHEHNVMKHQYHLPAWLLTGINSLAEHIKTIQNYAEFVRLHTAAVTIIIRLVSMNCAVHAW